MEQLVKFIIRPPRAEYDPRSDLLDEEFMVKGKWFQRKDVEIKNSRGDILQCSHYMPIVSPEGKPLPCVIYCHGNSGCRVDASEAALILLPSNITVFTLDFSGSGISGGEHVTLGWNEKDDLRAVVNYLRADGNVSLIGLWGRSMGAVTSLMYGAEDPSIAGMVLDSPFSDLVDLMMELVGSYRVRLPKFTVKFAIQYMRKAIQKKAKFDIMDLNTIKVAKSCFIPALLGHAIDDDFIQPHHSDCILEAYMGDKNLIKFEGDHNSPRPEFYFDSINIFFQNVLQPPVDEVVESFFDYFGEDIWRSVPELNYGDEQSSENKEPSTSGAVGAVNQVRMNRPMSGMEEDKCYDLSSSSSAMISFELSNGHPCGSHVPAMLDDDEYVEYPLEDFTDFQSNAKEEERVEQPPAGTTPIEPSHKDDSHASWHEIESSLAAAFDDPCGTLKADSNPISVIHSQNLACGPVPAPSVSSRGEALQASDTSSGTNSGNSTIASGLSDSSASALSSSDTDISHYTKATLTVIRNPTGHVLNGLIRRLDFNNFFRNSLSR